MERIIGNLIWFLGLSKGKFSAEIGNVIMAFEQIDAFLKKMQADPELKSEVLQASTADDVARIALKLGYEFSGDELLRASGRKVEKVTVVKNDLPGEYN